MIRFDNLTFSYAKKGLNPALYAISTTIQPGVHLLLGPNGAGKTTLLKVIDGALKPIGGECLIDGHNVAERKPSELSQVFYLPDECHLPLATINEMARVHACYYPTFSAEALKGNLEAFGMTGDEPLHKMSLGMSKKANVAYALALGTPVLLLDEPANGLDIQSKRALARLIAINADESRTIIIATHTVQDLNNLFDSVTILNHGTMLISATNQEIAAKLAFVTTDTPPQGAFFTEADLNGYHSVIANTEGVETPIDYILLYLAMTNTDSANLINYLRE